MVSRSAPKIVIAAPRGQHAEVDALASALIGSESGWKPVYFGPNLSAEEIAAAAEITQARAVALSTGSGKKPGIKQIKTELKRLRHRLENKIAIFTIGSGVSETDDLSNALVIPVRDLRDFRYRLEALPADPFAEAKPVFT